MGTAVQLVEKQPFERLTMDIFTDELLVLVGDGEKRLFSRTGAEYSHSDTYVAGLCSYNGDRVFGLLESHTNSRKYS